MVQEIDRAKKAETAIVVTNEFAATPDVARQFQERSGDKGALVADIGKVGRAFSALHCPKLWLLDKDGFARWTGGGEGDSRDPAALIDATMKAMDGLNVTKAPGG